MSTIRLSLPLSIVVATLLVSDVRGQESSRGQRSVRSTERVARASWRPTRSHVIQATEDASPSGRVTADAGLDSMVRLVDQHDGDQPGIEELPAPPAEQPSIVEPIEEAMPLDGQVMLAPLDGGSVACDALPGGCACGDSLCLGDCDASCDSCSTGSCGISGCSTCGELCSDVAWRPCITICLPQDGWVSFEYLGWWQDGMPLPPLVSTSSDPNVPRVEAGVLGAPTTQILYGGGDVLDDAFDGGRLRFGIWLDRCHTWGVGAEYFKIGSESETFSRSSSGVPILARPFFNTATGLEDAELIAFPDVVTGDVDVHVQSELVGGGVLFRYLTCCSEGCSKWLFCGCPEEYCSRTEALMGYRYLELEESVRISEDLTSIDDSAPGSFDITDRFRTRNQFNGFDMGWMYRRVRGFWTMDSTIRLAVGNTRQTVWIDGQTTVNDPTSEPQVQTLTGGFLAQTSNIGRYKQNNFTVVPEFNTNLGYQLTDHFRLMLGYTFIYWSNVVRPGHHISRDLNPNLLPPPADPFSGSQRPAFAFDTTDYWVQGINFGCEYRW